MATKTRKKKVYDNTNSGALWVNKNKKTDKHPDYTGTLDIQGVLYRIAAWDRSSTNDGAPIMGLMLNDEPIATRRMK